MELVVEVENHGRVGKGLIKVLVLALHYGVSVLSHTTTRPRMQGGSASSFLVIVESRCTPSSTRFFIIACAVFRVLSIGKLLSQTESQFHLKSFPQLFSSLLGLGDDLTRRFLGVFLLDLDKNLMYLSLACTFRGQCF